jgi:hypothetical protein
MMTFADFWASQGGAGVPAQDEARARAVAELAWDAALCAASAGCFERGQFRAPAEISASIQALHTWAETNES